MATKQEQRQFILDTLLPYKKDNNTCAISDGKCCYHTVRGGVVLNCAVGKHLVNSEEYKDDRSSVEDLPNFYDIITKEAFDMNFNISEWESFQGYHDSVATIPLITTPALKMERANEYVEELETNLEIDLTELKFDI